MNGNSFYLGNPHVKGDGVQQNFTAHEITEYQKCMNSVAYFCENYVKVIDLDNGLVPFKLRGYQTKLVDHYSNNRFSIVLAPRQSGKCASINTIVKIRNKKTGVIENVTIGELYERAKAKGNM